MARRRLRAHQVRPQGGVFPDQEEGRLDAMIRQDAQHLGRPHRIGAVVDGQGDVLGPQSGDPAVLQAAKGRG